MHKYTILLVEDEADVLQSNREFLKLSGYQTLAAVTLAEAWRILKSRAPDLILLDILLPDGNGLDFLAHLRAPDSLLRDIPVLFLTCLDSSASIIEGLTRGGCDYITKPYDFGVLKARIEAQLRRAEPRDVLACGPLTLHLLSQRALLSGRDIMLTQKEFAILLLLLRHEGEALTKEAIFREVWGQPLMDDGSALYMQISRLKKKLERGGALALSASRKEGYCLNILG